MAKAGGESNSDCDSDCESAKGIRQQSAGGMRGAYALFKHKFFIFLNQ